MLKRGNGSIANIKSNIRFIGGHRFSKSVASPVGLYSMDIEGGFGNDGNPSHTIVIHGYYKPPIGAEVYYHCNINSIDRLTNPGFEFSNISIPQIENGKSLVEVKKDVLRILNGKNVSCIRQPVI